MITMKDKGGRELDITRKRGREAMMDFGKKGGNLSKGRRGGKKGGGQEREKR